MRRGHEADRWTDRRVLAAALGLTVAVLPVAGSVAAVVLVERLIAAPDSVVGFGIWWLGTLAFCALVFLATERVARRALPLAVLLKMGMAFPGRAPKRLAVARRAGSVRDLHRRVEEARTRGLADEPTVAAEKIVTLAATLSAHDRTTRGHAERVRALTDMIAEELHLPPVHRDRLRWSSLLHDIGKLAVHPDILNKEGTLSDEEWEIIRRHPLEGARLTAPIAGWLGDWANTIAEHHERFDGRGYPYGIAGRRISLGGRVVAVADSYDVMTSMRSYKRPMAPDAARQELAACAGTQFDPDVVRAFLAVSVWRLRAAAPISWFGSMWSTKVVGVASRIGTVTGHSVIAGLAAGAGVLGLTALSPVASSAPTTPSTVIAGAAPVQGQTATSGSGANSGAGAAGSGGAGGGKGANPAKGSTTTGAGGATKSASTSTTTGTSGKSGSGTGAGNGNGGGSSG
ncbi:MAG TPA: HD-GYP domain-containing protein, partial [Acidimicrobiales bacterium]|nr:HD-GYP domain-containing protein [Acidimicrobiales bacterium]